MRALTRFVLLSWFGIIGVQAQTLPREVTLQVDQKCPIISGGRTVGEFVIATGTVLPIIGVDKQTVTVKANNRSITLPLDRTDYDQRMQSIKKTIEDKNLKIAAALEQKRESVSGKLSNLISRHSDHPFVLAVGEPVRFVLSERQKGNSSRRKEDGGNDRGYWYIPGANITGRSGTVSSLCFSKSEFKCAIMPSSSSGQLTVGLMGKAKGSIALDDSESMGSTMLWKEQPFAIYLDDVEIARFSSTADYNEHGLSSSSKH